MELVLEVRPGYSGISRLQVSDLNDKMMLHTLNEQAHLRPLGG